MQILTHKLICVLEKPYDFERFKFKTQKSNNLKLYVIMITFT